MSASASHWPPTTPAEERAWTSPQARSRGRTLSDAALGGSGRECRRGQQPVEEDSLPPPCPPEKAYVQHQTLLRARNTILVSGRFVNRARPRAAIARWGNLVPGPRVLCLAHLPGVLQGWEEGAGGFRVRCNEDTVRLHQGGGGGGFGGDGTLHKDLAVVGSRDVGSSEQRGLQGNGALVADPEEMVMPGVPVAAQAQPMSSSRSMALMPPWPAARPPHRRGGLPAEVVRLTAGQWSSPPTRGCSAAREAVVPALAGATRQLVVAATSRRSGVHSVPTKIRAIRVPAACSLAAKWPFPLVSGHARRALPAVEEPSGGVLAEEAGLLPGVREEAPELGFCPSGAFRYTRVGAPFAW